VKERRPSLLRLRGTHAWLVLATDGLPAAPPYLIHELYFSQGAHAVWHRRPYARCSKAVHRIVGSFMN
jgi:hypothetical protein